jgi:hypothetical protein
MAGITREEIAHVVGPAVDDSVILEIIATSASKVELEEAVAPIASETDAVRTAASPLSAVGV